MSAEEHYMIASLRDWVLSEINELHRTTRPRRRPISCTLSAGVCKRRSRYRWALYIYIIYIYIYIGLDLQYIGGSYTDTRVRVP